MKDEILGCIGAILAFIITLCFLVFMPIIVFGFGYLGGMILQWFVGDTITNGLNLVFNTQRFTHELIPITCATLATIGKYFKSSQPSKKKD